MLDSDLAEMYQVETKNLKRAVRSNIERFPDDFMFELTKEEYDSLRCKYFTLKSGRGHDKPRRDVWHHALYRQHGHKGELFIDGKLIGRNDRMPILAEIFKDTPANCWIGRAPFRGDKYLTQTDVADFRIYTYAVSDKDMRQLMKQAR